MVNGSIKIVNHQRLAHSPQSQQALPLCNSDNFGIFRATVRCHLIYTLSLLVSTSSNPEHALYSTPAHTTGS
ncbi:hypothetical protein V495_03713 [Pseudogymnoascus sp. VKM F-4514 (FW-929)]|nr:hypothetical protein V490_04685 [Pseudogymnoascus sp. VKM F-3557]KFY43862.1 hypothetical protein V495_03713 [Pseudogymnoascus sp. VKM F-4514 (FW-929)]KFY60617.1 hypothetical protein V497_03503 [Pseudogymnoascus sp. VKM F-4516 (FW-969)]